MSCDNLELQPYDHDKVKDLAEQAARLGITFHIAGIPFGADRAVTASRDAEVEAIVSLLRSARRSARNEAIEECAKVADYGVERAHRDWGNLEKADGAQEMAAEVAQAIRSLKDSVIQQIEGDANDK